MWYNVANRYTVYLKFLGVGCMNSCCFLGHRTINETDELKAKLHEAVERLIVQEDTDTFLFGSKSRFNDLCLEIVSEMKKKYPHIKRVYVRAEYPVISDSYRAYLLEKYEDTYYPESIVGSGRAVYVKRNYEMIDNSRFCIVYFDGTYVPNGRKSGTETALNYAKKKKKELFVFSG